MNLDLLENRDSNFTEFYKVSWISPFNNKYKRNVEPGITAINKIYRKIIYNIEIDNSDFSKKVITPNNILT
tara:strand:- start:444 stop:656 length:213 start_codon:yes stop_codon:yes gene_type:complete